MPSRVWSHLCDYATINSGKATIIGEFDRIYTPTLPIKHVMFFVVTKWQGENGEAFDHRIRIIGTNRETITESVVSHCVIPDGGNGFGYLVTADSFVLTPFMKYGECSVEIIMNNIPVHIMPLFIVKQ